MPIKNVLIDYTGRKKDINIFYGIDPKNAATQVVNPKFGHISSFVAGIQKLVQRYAISLLTIVGSQKYYPSFGTDLISTIHGGNLIGKSDLFHIFNFANSDVIDRFRSYQEQNDTDPNDERLSTAYIKDVFVESGKVSLSIRIISEAGEEVDILLPLPEV